MKQVKFGDRTYGIIEGKDHSIITTPDLIHFFQRNAETFDLLHDYSGNYKDTTVGELNPEFKATTACFWNQCRK